MVWVLVVVVVSLVVVLAQLLLHYQKRASRLKIAQNPVRRQIDNYKQKLVEMATEVRAVADEGVEQLQKDMADFTRRSGHAANIVAELDDEAHAKAAEMDMESEEEEDEDSEDGLGGEAGNGEAEAEEHDIIGERKDPSMRIEADRINPVELVRAIRHDLEETYDYMESLRTDANIVTQTAGRLGTADKGAGSSKD